MNDTPEATPETVTPVDDARSALFKLRMLVRHRVNVKIDLLVDGLPITVDPATFAGILKLVDQTELATQNAVADAAEARTELARRLRVLDDNSALPPETLRGWRFAAQSALGMLAQGTPNVDWRSLIEALLASVNEVERLIAVVGERDTELASRDAALAEYETRMSAIETRLADLADSDLGIYKRPPSTEPDDAPPGDNDTPSGIVFDDLKALAAADDVVEQHVALPGIPDVTIARELFERGNVFVEGVKVSASQPSNDPAPEALADRQSPFDADGNPRGTFEDD